MNIADYLKPHLALAANLARKQGRGDEAARWERLFESAAAPAVEFAESAKQRPGTPTALIEALEAIADLPEPDEETSYNAIKAAYAWAREIARKAVQEAGR